MAGAIATGFANLVQQDFQASMLTLMSQSKGGKLLELCEKRELKGAETTRFNRAEDGEAVDTAPQLLGGATAKSTGIKTGYAEVGPAFVYAYEQVKDSDMKITQVSLQGYIPASLIRQLERAIDRKILQAVHTASTSTESVTDAAGIKSSAAVTKLIATAKKTRVLAEDTPDKRSFVKMVMSVDTYSELYSNDLLINSDYIGQAKLNSASVETFYSAEVVVMKDDYKDAAGTDSILPLGVVYFIPSMTIGAATWSGADAADSSYDIKNADMWTFVAKKSFGAVVIEEKAITKVTITKTP